LSYGRSCCPEDRPAQRWERLPAPRRPAKSARSPTRPGPPAHPDVGLGPAAGRPIRPLPTPSWRARLPRVIDMSDNEIRRLLAAS